MRKGRSEIPRSTIVISQKRKVGNSWSLSKMRTKQLSVKSSNKS